MDGDRADILERGLGGQGVIGVVVGDGDSDVGV